MIFFHLLSQIVSPTCNTNPPQQQSKLFKYLYVLKIMLQGSKSEFIFDAKHKQFYERKTLHFYKDFSLILNFPDFDYNGETCVFKKLILLFFFKNKFQKYLPGSGQFKFEFSKDFSKFILLHARWTESIHSKYLKLKQTDKKITQKAAIKQNVCIKVGTFVLA